MVRRYSIFHLTLVFIQCSIHGMTIAARIAAQALRYSMSAPQPTRNKLEHIPVPVDLRTMSLPTPSAPVEDQFPLAVTIDDALTSSDGRVIDQRLQSMDERQKRMEGLMTEMVHELCLMRLRNEGG